MNKVLMNPTADQMIAAGISLILLLLIFLAKLMLQRNRYRASLLQKEFELKESEHSIRQLEDSLSLASHDLKTPLRNIIGFSQLLQRQLGERATKTQNECIEYMVRSTRDMSLLIEEMLEYSSVRHASLQIVPIHIPSLLQEVVDTLGQLILKCNAQIDLKSSSSILYGDHRKLRQVLQNLIFNGIKYQQRGNEPNIKVTVTEHQDHWLFRVADNGIGIDPVNQDQIFQIFKRLHSKNEYEGSGIGLAICQRIIKQHQGAIWVESEKGGGSRFYFTIDKNLSASSRKQQPKATNSVKRIRVSPLVQLLS